MFKTECWGKLALLIFAVAAVVGLSSALMLPLETDSKQVASETEFQNGDIVFQSSKSGQSLAIQLATGSEFSHVGLLFDRHGDGEWWVLEAVQPVKWTPLAQFRLHGDGGKIAVRRLSNTLTEAQSQALRAEAESHLSKQYDMAFDWSDEEMYCSELVWKAYQRAADVELGALKALKEYDLKHPAVKKQMKRYAGDMPWDHPMIAPGAVFNAPVLQTVLRE